MYRAFKIPELLIAISATCLLPPISMNAQQDGAQRWAFSTLSSATAGNVVSSPAVAPDGTVYIGVEVGLSTSATTAGKLFAIKPDGSVKWSFSTPDWIDSSPAIAPDGTVYIGCWDGNLYAIKPDGTKLWSFQTAGFVASSPAVASDGTIYVGSGDGSLYAITPSGTQKWSFPTPDWIDCAPAIGLDGTVYFGSWDKSFYAVDANGSEKWHYATGGSISSSPAIAADGTIYVGSKNNSLYAFTPTGTLKWAFDAGDVVDASPVIGLDGVVYFGALNGRFFAVKPDGTEKWRYPAAAQPALKSIYSTAAVRSDGSILFGSSNSAVYSLKTDGTLLWTTALGDWADSSPVVSADGSIYIGCTDKKLYALTGTKDGMTTDWAQYHRDAMHNAQQVMGSLTGTTGKLINLSTRAVAGTGADTLITGFITSGSGQRTILVRGVGPTLANFGVTGTLANPLLKEFSGNTLIASNDDWGTSSSLAQINTATSATGAFALPSNSLDAVLLGNFSPGGYTVHVVGSTGGTGVALMELYDTGGSGQSRLINLSARSTVGTGGNVLIAGFIISQGSRSLLIRGVGPTLGSFGVGGVLLDPKLQLHNSTQIIAENNDWGSASNGAAMPALAQSVGAFPLTAGSQDSTLIVTLPPGSYTAIISGVNLTTGVALVEVYEIP